MKPILIISSTWQLSRDDDNLYFMCGVFSVHNYKQYLVMTLVWNHCIQAIIGSFFAQVMT